MIQSFLLIGDEIISVTGTNLPTGFGSVLVGSTQARVISRSSQQITFVSPKLTPGLYDLIIPAGTIGNTKWGDVITKIIICVN